MTTGGRHDVRGGGPVPPDGDELIELLYGELPPDEERAVRARVAGDPNLSAQLSELERVREMVRGMPEEEPPSAISAQLMAAAAQAASRRGGTAPAVAPGFWSRVRSWFQPLIAHPGLAAACSVVLVAGVAGVLILRQGEKLAPATRTAEPMEPATGMAESADQPAPATAPSAESAPGTGYAAGDQAAVESEPDPAKPADDDVSGVVSSDKTRVARRTRAIRPDDGKDVDRDERARQAGPAGGALGMTDKKAAKPSQEKSPDSGGRGSTDSAANEEAEAQGAEGSAAPAPPPASAPSAPQPSQTAAGDDSSSSALDLHKQAVAAAASKRCLEVQSLEQRIRSIDPAYHEKAVLRDKRLAVCLSANKPAKARRK